MLTFAFGGNDHELDTDMQENPKRHMQDPSYGHNLFEHSDTVVSTYRTRTYGDGQVSV